MRRMRLRAGVTTVSLVPALLTAVPGRATAAPPDADELGRKAEIITEQYNGKRLELARAQRANAAAQRQLRRNDEAYQDLRRQAGSLAAARYMNPGTESEITLLTGGDPQAVLDRGATATYLTAQQTQRLRELLLARMRYQRSLAAVQDRTRQIQRVTADLARKKAAIQKMVSRIPAAPRTRGRPPSVSVSVPASGKASVVVNAALSRVGKPYVWGGAGPNSFDCSGLMLWAYKKVGINLPHYTGSQYNMGSRITSRDQVRPGDILFFYPDLGHNGMYIGNGKMVHAPRSGKTVEVVDLATYYWSNFVGGSRILS